MDIVLLVLKRFVARPFALVGVLFAPLVFVCPDMPSSVCTFGGLTAAEWQTELSHWTRGAWGWSNKGGHWAFWVRAERRWEGWLERLGMRPGRDRYNLPLLNGDPDAVAVLIELLSSRNSQTRLVAVQGLEKVGEPARACVPALLRAIEDEDWDVRSRAEQALFRIERSTAEQVGIEWTIMGLVRKGRSE